MLTCRGLIEDPRPLALAPWKRTPRINVARFWALVARTSPDDDACWLWRGSLDDATGYGVYGKLGAHRVAWGLTHSWNHVGFFVCHRCDVRLCVRPSHLFLGTARHNNQDAKKKHRAVEMKRVRVKTPAGHRFTLWAWHR